MSDPKPTMTEALRAVPKIFRGQVSWGDRGGGKYFQAAVGPYDTIGKGGPFDTAAEAVMAGARIARAELSKKHLCPICGVVLTSADTIPCAPDAGPCGIAAS